MNKVVFPAPDYEAKEVLGKIIHNLEWDINDIANKLRIAKLKRNKLKEIYDKI